MILCSIGLALGLFGASMVLRKLVLRRHGCGPRGRRGLGRSFWLRAVFARLDTTPGQEREIRAALEEFRHEAREAKRGLRGAREDLARAMRSDAFDEQAAGDVSSRVDETGARVKAALAAALKRVHAILDMNQRARLADMLAEGPAFARWGGPYRS